MKDVSDDRVAKPSFVVGEENVSIAENIKYLGVIVDKHLSWDEQISSVTKKVSRGLGMLRFSKKHLPIVTVQKMYRSLVEPYFRYSCPVWGVAGINAINRLQKPPKQGGKNRHKQCFRCFCPTHNQKTWLAHHQ